MILAVLMLLFMAIGIIVGYNCRKYECKDIPDYMHCSTCPYRKNFKKEKEDANE